MTTTITAKGQVTIPKRVRDAMGAKPGTKVTVEYADGGAIIRPVRKIDVSDYRKRLESVRGTLDLGMSTDDYMKMLRGED
jgi:AbrB family looped-hinge helix DNA binding protein